MASPEDFHFREESLGSFLELIASDRPAPGGGSVAAVATAMAAGLVAMAARLSTGHLPDAPAIASEADRLQRLAATLADDDAAAYRDVMAARASVEVEPDERRARLREALVRATDVPLELARVATETAALGARMVKEGNPNLEGDSVTAVLLALAVVRASTALAKINVALGNLESDRLAPAAGYLATAVDIARRIGVGDGQESPTISP